VKETYLPLILAVDAWGKVSSTGEKSIVYRCKSPWTPEGTDVEGDVLYILETTFPELRRVVPRLRKRKPDGTLVTIFEFSE